MMPGDTNTPASAPVTSHISPGRGFGQYQIIKRLDQGGMASVWLAVDALNRQVALKIPRLEGDSALERFRQEALTTAQLMHPNIVTIYAAGDVDGNPYLAMEFVVGRSLRAVLEDEGALPPRRAVSIASQIASALDYAHSLGIIHRDVKPENIMLQTTGKEERARLLDFGIALRVGGPRLTQEGFAQGTLLYIAPESLQPGVYDGRSDLYALGLVVFEMLTGRLPFKGNTAESLMWARLNVERITKESTGWGLSDPLFDVLQKSLLRNPDGRFQAAVNFKDALEDAISRTERAQIGISCREPYAEARRAFAVGDLPGALRLARQVAELDPHYEDVQGLIVRCERQLHEREAQSLLNKASDALDRRRFADAVDLLDQVMDLELHLDVAGAKREVALRGIKAEQHLAKAREFAGSMQWREAWSLLEEARKLVPDLAGLAELREQASARLAIEDDFRRGVNLAESGRWTEAVEVLALVLKRDPARQEATAWLARATKEKEVARLYADAIKAFAADEFGRCSELLATLEETSPDHPDPDGLRERLVEESNIAGLYEQACRAELGGDFRGAIHTLTSLMSRRPLYRDVSDRLARLRRWMELDKGYQLTFELVGRGRFDEALEVLARIRAADDSFPDRDNLQGKAEAGRELRSLLERAQGAFKRGLWQECAECCDKVLVVVPGHEKALALRRRAARARWWGWWYRWGRWFKVATAIAVVLAMAAMREPIGSAVKQVYDPDLPIAAGPPAQVAAGGALAVGREGVRVWVPGAGVASRSGSGMEWKTFSSGLEDAIRDTPNRRGLLAASPADGRTLYLGLDTELYVSGDAGASWTSTSWQAPVQSLSIASVQGQPDRILLAGTGAGERGIRYSSSPAVEGWQVLSSDEMGEIQAFAVDPGNVNTVYAGESGKNRVWATFDGGMHWRYSRVPDGGSVVALALARGRPMDVIAAANPGGLLRSVDGGKSWAAIEGWPQLIPADIVQPGRGEMVFAGGWAGGLWIGAPGHEWRQLLYARVHGLAVTTDSEQSVFVLTEDGGRYRLIELSPDTLEQTNSSEVVATR